jgi:hypothetical protein
MLCVLLPWRRLQPMHAHGVVLGRATAHSGVLQELVRVLKNFKSVRDPLRPRSSYVDQVTSQSASFSMTPVDVIVVLQFRCQADLLQHVICLVCPMTCS